MALKSRKNNAAVCKLVVLGQDADLNYDVEIWVMRSGVNRNTWDYRNVETYAGTFRGTPILCAYMKDGKIGSGHNMGQTVLPDGSVVYDFTGAEHERIVGAIGESDGDVRTEERDGETWVIVKGKLWRFYNRKLVDKIARQGRMEVSAETDVEEEHEEDGISVFTRWRALGVTILGDGVAPAIPGANIQRLKALEEKFNSVKLAAASYHKNNEDKKGVNKNLNIFNKKQLAELDKRFDGYVVLAACEDEESHSVTVKLRDNSFGFYSYKMDALDETIVPEKFCALYTMTDLGDGLFCDAADLFDDLNAEVVKLNAKIAQLTKTAEDSAADMKAMQDAEMKRRTKAAKDAAVRQLAEINANREEAERFADELIAPVLNSAEKGAYNSFLDEDGLWNGEMKAMSAVRDLAMTKQMELDKARFEMAKNAAKRSYAFEPGFDGAASGGVDSIESLYRNMVGGNA